MRSTIAAGWGFLSIVVSGCETTPEFEGFTGAWVFPYVVMSQAAPGDGAHSWDTEFTLVGNQLREGSAETVTASLFLYRTFVSSEPWKTADDVEICNPCSFTVRTSYLGEIREKQTISVREMLERAVGGIDPADERGLRLYAVWTLSSNDPNDVVIEETIVQDHEGTHPGVRRATDHGTWVSADPTPSSLRPALFFPHVTSTSMVTTEFMAISGRAPLLQQEAIRDGASFYFLDDSGEPVQSGTGQDVCNPCRLTVGNSSGWRYDTLNLDNVIRNAGGYPEGGTLSGYGVFTVDSNDPSSLIIERANVVSYGGDAEDRLFTIDHGTWVELDAEADDDERLLVFPFWILARDGERDQIRAEFEIVTTAGFPDTAPSDLEADLFLFDQHGLPLRGEGNDVCNPCTTTFRAGGRRKQILRVRELVSEPDSLADPQTGFAAIRVADGNPNGIAVERRIIVDTGIDFSSDHGSWHVADAASSETRWQALVFPRLLETPEEPLHDAPDATDSIINLLDTAGLPSTSIPTGGDVHARLFLRSDLGSELVGIRSRNICDPCRYHLDDRSGRSMSMSVDDIAFFDGDDPLRDGSSRGFAYVRSKPSSRASLLSASLVDLSTNSYGDLLIDEREALAIDVSPLLADGGIDGGADAAVPFDGAVDGSSFDAQATDASAMDDGAVDAGQDAAEPDAGAYVCFSRGPHEEVEAADGYRAVIVASAGIEGGGLTGSPRALSFAGGPYGDTLFSAGVEQIVSVDYETGDASSFVTSWPEGATLSNPTWLTWDSENQFDGALYAASAGKPFADGDSTIFRIASDGTATLFASGDGPGLDDLYTIVFSPGAPYPEGLIATGVTNLIVGDGDWVILDADANRTAFSEVESVHGVAVDRLDVYGGGVFAARPATGSFFGDGTVSPIHSDGSLGTPLVADRDGIHALVAGPSEGPFGNRFFAADWTTGELLQIEPDGSTTTLATWLVAAELSSIAVSPGGRALFFTYGSAIMCLEPVSPG